MMQNNPLLLVTGATGLVGWHVVDQALRLGYRTRILSRTPGGAGLWHGPVEMVLGDLTVERSLEPAFKEVTHVVHCAAKVGDFGALADYRAVNVEGTRALIALAKRQSTLRRMVMISSLGVYRPGDHFGTTEEQPLWPQGLDAYTRSKAESETMMLGAHLQHGLPVAVLRPGFIYGAHDRTLLPRILKKLAQRQLVYFGSGEQRLSNTYVANLCDAVFLALNQPLAVGEVFNITDDPTVSKREFIATIARLAGYPEPHRSIPRALARAVCASVDEASRLIGGRWQPPVSRATYKFLGLNLDFSIDKARRLLGYAPVWSFAVGAEASIRWFRETGRLAKR